MSENRKFIRLVLGQLKPRKSLELTTLAAGSRKFPRTGAVRQFTTSDKLGLPPSPGLWNEETLAYPTCRLTMSRGQLGKGSGPTHLCLKCSLTFLCNLLALILKPAFCR